MSGPRTTREALIAEVLGDLDGLLARVEALPALVDGAESKLSGTVAALDDAGDKFRLAVTAFTEQAKADFLDHELETIKTIGSTFDQIAIKRAEILVEAHERFRKVIGGKRYKVVEPVLPMDLMGIYILLPDTQR